MDLPRSPCTLSFVVDPKSYSCQPTPKVAMQSNQDRNRDPTAAELQEAAEGFSAWVQSKAPGAVVFVTGGFSVMKLGGTRTTKDVDLAMDLSNTKRANGNKFTTNGLKDLAVEEPDRFVVGLKIFWKLANVNVQVDFVDANLFWQPTQILQSTITLPSTDLLSLSPPTLLVGKIISAIERNQTDKAERRVKQLNDITDALFLLKNCLTFQRLLTKAHVDHMRKLDNLKAFVDLFHDLDIPLDEFKANWNKLCGLSGEEAKDWHLK